MCFIMHNEAYGDAWAPIRSRLEEGIVGLPAILIEGEIFWKRSVESVRIS